MIFIYLIFIQEDKFINVHYFKLECWKYEPNERPNIQDVVSTLKTIIYPKQNTDAIMERENNQLEKNETISEPIKRTMDLNNELMSYNSLNIDTINGLSLQNN